MRPVYILCRLVLLVILWQGHCSSWARDWYFDAHVGAAYLDIPEHQFFARRGESAPFARMANLSTSESGEWGFGLGGKAGQILDTPLFFADSSRLELSGFFIDRSETTTAQFVDGGAGERYGWVQLDGSTGFGTPNGAQLNTWTRREIDFGGYSILLHQDRQWAAGSMSTFYGGFAAQHLYQDTEAHGRITTAVELNEKLNTDYFGGKIGWSGWHAVNDRWTIVLDSDVGVYGARSRYQGEYANDFGSGPGPLIVQRRSSNDTAVGLNVNLNVTRQLSDDCFLSCYTGLQHLSYAPQIQYGEIGSATPPNGTPEIVGDELTALLLGLRITVFR